MNRRLNFIFSVLGISVLLLTNFYQFAGGSLTFNGVSVLIIIETLLVSPVINVFRYRKRYITTKEYYPILSLTLLYTLGIMIQTLFIHYSKVDGRNLATAYLTDHLLILFGLFGLTFFYSLFCKKEIVTATTDHTRWFFLGMALTSFFPLFSDTTDLATAISFALAIFSLIMVFRYPSVIGGSHLRAISFAMFLFNIISLNFTNAIILLFVIVNSDTNHICI